MEIAKAAAFLFFSLLLLLFISDQSSLDPDTSSNSNLISDGICHETCKQAYGILPCSTTFWGNLFIVLLYGYLTFFASKYISSGSELLLEILGSSFVCGVFLPIVDALPNAILILVSGLSGSKETAQKQVQIGMGLLAGSTVMLLTLLWGSCVLVGKCDLVNSTSSDSQDSKWCSLTGSGVTTDAPTCHASKIMIISVIPFIVVQLPKVFHISSGSRITVLISLILAVAFLISYCVYQIWKRREGYVKRIHMMSGILRDIYKTAMGRLLDENGKPNKPVIEKLFHRLDLNHDGHVSSQELTALIIGINFLKIDLDRDDAVDKVMDDLDMSGDRLIDLNEFFNGISRWLEEAERSVVQGGSSTNKYEDFHMIQKRIVEYVKRIHIMSGVLRHMHNTAMGRLLDENDKPNKPVIEKLFHRLDLNHDGHVSSQELTALIIGINFLNIDLDREDAVDKVMDDLDMSGDRPIDLNEFFNGISRWLEEAKRSVVQGGSSANKYEDFDMKTWEEYNEMADNHNEIAEGVESPTWVSIKAGLMLLLGTVIAFAFADPLVESVTDFSNATNIPSFFISFIAMPLATNSREAVSAIIIASKKKQRTTSLTFSQIYGGVTTNNLICLAVFLALVYVRHLTWDFSAEVLVILIVCIVMGLFTSFSTTYPLWTCSIAFLLYALSLVLIYVLKWS